MYSVFMSEDTQAPNDTQDAEAITKSPSGTEGLRVLSNGTLFDPVRGRFVAGGKPTTAIQDSAAGRQLGLRRQEIAAQKARAALVEAYTQHTGKPGGRPSDAYGELAGEFARSALANAMNKPREGVEAGKFALRLAKMLPEADKQQNIGVAVQIVLAPEAASFVEGIWSEEP